MSFEPLKDRVVIKQEEAKKQTEGGIYIPDKHQDAPDIGTVVAVGPGRYVDSVFVSTELKKGDRVLYSKYGGTKVEVDGESVIVLREDEILGRFCK